MEELWVEDTTAYNEMFRMNCETLKWNIDRCRACDYQNSWPKNYNIITIIRVVKREKLSSIIMKNLNKPKLNNSLW